MVIQMYEMLSIGEGLELEMPALKEFFDFQVNTLCEKGIVKNPDELSGLWKNFPKSGTGLFIIVPEIDLPLSELVKLIECEGLKGRSQISDECQFTDIVKIPETPYLCLGVEDGRTTSNILPSNIPDILKHRGRSPYSAREGVFHAIYWSEVLISRSMLFCGSRMLKMSVLNGKNPEFKPSLSWDDEYFLSLGMYEQGPCLRDHFYLCSYPRLGLASCKSRVGL